MDYSPVMVTQEPPDDKPVEQQLTGSFNRIEGPCPLCRQSNWVRLLIPGGQVQCEKCLSRYTNVIAYVAKVEEAYGHGAYQLTVASIVASAAASGLLE